MENRSSGRRVPAVPAEFSAGCQDARPDATRTPAADTQTPRPDLTLVHQLAERLTAAGNYLSVLRRRAARTQEPDCPQPLEILERAISQLDQAGDLLRQLRRALDR
jgi:hypothetical protein